MATKDQVNAFIAKLAAIARKEYLTRDKWVLPSVCIAQAALETGWGTSGLMTKANAFFGIKAGNSWKGKVYSSKTNSAMTVRHTRRLPPLSVLMIAWKRAWRIITI